MFSLEIFDKSKTVLNSTTSVILKYLYTNTCVYYLTSLFSKNEDEKNTYFLDWLLSGITFVGRLFYLQVYTANAYRH